MEFYSFIQCGSGRFELCLFDEVIMTGRIHRPDTVDMATVIPKMKYPNSTSDIPHSSLSKQALYTLLEQKGYQLGEKFKTVTNIDLYFEGII